MCDLREGVILGSLVSPGSKRGAEGSRECGPGALSGSFME